jgi:hypothetical protein
MLSRLFERFDPDLYHVRDGQNTLGEAETIEDDDEDEDDNRGASPVGRRGRNRKARDKNRGSLLARLLLLKTS